MYALPISGKGDISSHAWPPLASSLCLNFARLISDKVSPGHWVSILHEGGWLSPCSLAISISPTGVYDWNVGLPSF